MKKALLFLVCMPLIVFSQQTVKQKQAVKGFTVTGTVTGFEEGTLVKLTNANDKSELGSGKIEHGKFHLTGSVEEPVLGSLVFGKEPQQFVYIENKNITITGSKADLKNLKVTGSVSHNDFMQFQQTFNPIFTTLNATVSSLNMAPKNQEDLFNSLMKRYDSLKAVAAVEVDKFIAAKSKSYIAPFLIFVTGEMFDDPILMESRYNKLDTSIQHSIIGKNLGSLIAYNKVGAIGTTALDFTQPDTTGQPVALSSFRGKYVLVDFWASWCGPCRAENPNVLSNYYSFKDKNFTVLGVSLDRPDGKANWLAAIQRDRLAWTQVSDLKYWNNEAAQLYRVQSIPFNLLVDPTGKIVGKNLRGEALHSKLCELLGCN